MHIIFFLFYLFFFFNDTATTEIYTLSLHDALPSCAVFSIPAMKREPTNATANTSVKAVIAPRRADRKSTRLNSSHSSISYAVFCLKKKNTNLINRTMLHTKTNKITQ